MTSAETPKTPVSLAVNASFRVSRILRDGDRRVRRYLEGVREKLVKASRDRLEAGECLHQRGGRGPRGTENFWRCCAEC